MSLLNLPLTTTGRALPTTTAVPVAASSVSLSATGPVGATASNPFMLPANTNAVPFGLGSQPQFVSTGGTVYQYDQTTDKTLNYKATNNNSQALALTYTGKNSVNSTVVGYEYSRQQVGTESYQVGTERYVSGYKNQQTGTEQYVTGTESYQTGTKPVLTGYKDVQVGTEKYVTGTEQYVTGTESYQT